MNKSFLLLLCFIAPYTVAMNPSENECWKVLQHFRSVWTRHGWNWTEESESDGTIIFRSEGSVIRIDPKTVHETFFNQFEALGGEWRGLDAFDSDED